MITIAACVIALVFWPVTLFVLAVYYWPVTLAILAVSFVFFVIGSALSAIGKVFS